MRGKRVALIGAGASGFQITPAIAGEVEQLTVFQRRSQPSVKHSFYKNAHGEVHILSPWRLVDYWAWTRQPNPDDFVFR